VRYGFVHDRIGNARRLKTHRNSQGSSKHTFGFSYADCHLIRSTLTVRPSIWIAGSSSSGRFPSGACSQSGSTFGCAEMSGIA